MTVTLAKFTAFAVSAILIFLVIFNTMNNAVSGESRDYRAEFSNVNGLIAGDDIRVAGVRVGRVNGVEVTEDAHAVVEFTLAAGQKVFTNTRLTVRYQNLLGQRYLALTQGPGAHQEIPEGGLVPMSQTDPGFDLTALLNGFEPLFSVLQPHEINKMANSLIATLQGEGGSIESLLVQTAKLTKNLANRDQVIGEVLDNLTPLMVDLAKRSKDFTGTVDQLTQLVKGMSKDRKKFGEALEGMDDLAVSVSSLLRDAGPAVDTNVEKLRRLMRIYVSLKPEFVALLKSLKPTLGAFARPMSYGSWLNMYFCNLTADVGLATVTFGGEGAQHSEVCR